MKKFILLVCIGLYSLADLSAEALFSKEELDNPRKYSAKFDSVFRVDETHKLKIKIVRNQVILHNNYASATINNASFWRSSYLPDSIHLILSKYPLDKEKWLTNYYDLLASRLKALYAIDPRLNNPYLTHVLVLQTSCNTEEEAKSLFHGFIIYAHQEGIPLLKKELKVSAKEIDLNKSEVEIDSTFYPEGNLCSLNGDIYCMAEFQNKVWISWQEGVVLTSDTFNTFQNASSGFTDAYFNSLVVYKNALYGMSNRGRIWQCGDSTWQLVFAPTSNDSIGEGLISNDSVLIAVYKTDEFYISTDGNQFVNRFYRERINGQWVRQNLSPMICFSGDSILLFSGSKILLSTDNLLNIKVIYEFRKKQTDFISSVLIDQNKWYLTGWFQDEEFQYHQILQVSIDAGKHWQKIQTPAKGLAFYRLYQKGPNEALWLVGGGTSDYEGFRTYLRNKGKWYQMDIPNRRVYLHYGSYYIAGMKAGILLLIPDSEINLN